MTHRLLCRNGWKYSFGSLVYGECGGAGVVGGSSCGTGGCDVFEMVGTPRADGAIELKAEASLDWQKHAELKRNDNGKVRHLIEKRTLYSYRIL